MEANDLDRLADLTGRYARYSRSAGGLSLVLGGALCFIVFVVGAIVDLSPMLRYGLASAPLLWLLAKELLQRLYYQRQGSVCERPSDKLRRMHRWMVVYLCVVSLLILGNVALTNPERYLHWPSLGYLLLVAALPFAAMRWFWSTGDFLVGVLLFCQSAVVIGGGHYPSHWIPIAAVFAAIAILAGWRDHRDYLRLKREFTDLGAPA